MTWLEDPDAFDYVRELEFWDGRATLSTDPPPDLGHTNGRLVAYPVHARRWRGHRVTRFWYAAPWDPYQAGEPIEAVQPRSVQPGRPSLPYVALRRRRRVA